MATIDHVELLAHLRKTREDSFSLADLTGVLRKPGELVALCVDALVEAGLVAQLSDGAYRYAPRGQALDDTAEKLIQLYNERPVTLVRLLYEAPPTAVNTFADAFMLRKKDK